MNAIDIVGDRLAANCEIIERYGCTILKIKDGTCRGKILAMKSGSEGSEGFIVSIGQRVTSKNGSLIPVGTFGLVIEIGVPLTGCSTSDVIKVWFEGQMSPIDMKFRDLSDLPVGSL